MLEYMLKCFIKVIHYMMKQQHAERNFLSGRVASHHI